MRGIAGSNPTLGTYTFFPHFFLTLNMLYDETLLEKNIFLNVLLLLLLVSLWGPEAPS